ncbi:MAG: phosphoadenylyl-sulfate reductase [Candidatus Schekmanbacteria bacterium]|nr:MAG: phosphoadenylyl-sulfate reductase [Candidatus Schekmanbacteria bacterium]
MEQVIQYPDELRKYEFLEELPAAKVLEWAFKEYGKRAAIGTSLQKTGTAIIDITSKVVDEFRVYFVDTLCHFKETYELLEEIEKRYNIKIERYTPDKEKLEELQREFGQFPYYSKFGRSRCCRIKKVEPNERALKTLDVWISGLRFDQSEFRKSNARKVEIIEREGRKILKINPLYDWTEKDVDEYIKKNNVPYNKLYDYKSPYGEVYKVIGCQPCHIPIFPTRHKRAGKFPWECGEKECGIHIDGSGI